MTQRGTSGWTGPKHSDYINILYYKNRPHQTYYDYSGGSNVDYGGFAAPGELKSASGWSLVKYLYSGNNVTGITYPNNVLAEPMDFKYKWANRKTYLYVSG